MFFQQLGDAFVSLLNFVYRVGSLQTSAQNTFLGLSRRKSTISQAVSISFIQYTIEVLQLCEYSDAHIVDDNKLVDVRLLLKCRFHPNSGEHLEVFLE